MDGLSVEIACFDRRHSFIAAKAAAEAEYLRKFYTTVFVDRTALPYRLLLPGLRGPLSSTRSRLLQHEARELDPSLVEDFPVLGLGLKAITGSRRMAGSNICEALNVLASIAFDRRILRRLRPDTSIFHAFARYSADSINRAKTNGTTVLLDQPEPHVDYMRAASAREREAERPGTEDHQHPLEAIDLQRRRREVATADYVLTGLDFVRRTVVESGYPADRVFLVPYGVSVPQGIGDHSCRSDSGSFRLLFVGALSWVKGLHHFLRAVERIDRPGVEIIVVGRAHGMWGKLFAQRMVGDPRIRWVPGMPQQDLFELYRTVDALVFPSLVGGIGLVVYEAMSFGVPVIVSDGDVVIRDGVDGLVAPPSVRGSLEDAILTLHANEELRRKLGRSAKERVKEFSWEAYMTGVQQTYEAIAQRERTN